MSDTGAPILLAVAHGTKYPNGVAEVRRLTNIVRTKRPGLRVELAWLERSEPLLADVLPTLDGPVAVVPLLLSTGFHVKVDITRAVGKRPNAAIAAQLGPDKRITKVVYERLLAVRGTSLEDVVLFASGSSDPEAAEQLDTAANQLARALHVKVYPRFLTNRDPASGLPMGCHVANYLLAPGFFNDRLRSYAEDELMSAAVADPIGAHPLVAEVVLDRYDAALRELAGAG